jgi:hypothetical protein
MGANAGDVLLLQHVYAIRIELGVAFILIAFVDFNPSIG